jgi:hypothetical protein
MIRKTAGNEPLAKRISKRGLRIWNIETKCNINENQL